MALESLAAWHRSSSHEVVEDLNYAFSAAHSNVLAIRRDSKVDAFKISYSVDILVELELACKGTADPVKLELGRSSQGNYVFAVGCELYLRDNVPSQV